MPDSPKELTQLAVAIGVGIVFGGTIVRFLVNKWLKDREDFEKGIVADIKNVHSRFDHTREYIDRGVEMARKEGHEAHRVLREHVDHEDKILRDRYHQLDTLAQIVVNDIKLIRGDLKSVVDGQTNLAKTIHDLDITLARFANRKE